jgi:hypothetical protein
LNSHVVVKLVPKIRRHNDTSFKNRLIRNENILYLGGIVLDYCFNKEKMFDGGETKICPVDLEKIPRSGSVQNEIFHKIAMI